MGQGVRPIRARRDAGQALFFAALFVFALPAGATGQSPELQPVFADGFESGTVSQWPVRASDEGDLSVTAAAALAGTYGLQAVVDDQSSLYLQDDSVSVMGPFYRYDREAYYHASFRFDPNGFDPGEAQGAARTRIFIGFQEQPQQRLFAIVLRRRGGQFALMGRVRQDDSGQVDTGFVEITDDPHLIEVQWHRSSAPNAADGLFRLTIDGAAVATLEGLDNHAGVLDFTRLGALSVKSGANGTLHWDDFRSFRDLTSARAQLRLNEVDYDQPGDDTLEFVEVYNPGPAIVDATGVYVVMIDGASHALTSWYTHYVRVVPGQYMVVANRALTVAPGAWRQNLILDRNEIGNGAPDGLMLLYQSPSGCVVIDALSYEGPMSSGLPFFCGYASFVEGSVLPAHIADSDVIPGSLVRLPNGSDTDDAATDWTFSTTPTPGRANVP